MSKRLFLFLFIGIFLFSSQAMADNISSGAGGATYNGAAIRVAIDLSNTAQMVGQTINLSGSGSYTPNNITVWLNISATVSAKSISVSIYNYTTNATSTNGLPTGAYIYRSTIPVEASGTTGKEIAFNFTGSTNLSKGTPYMVVISSNVTSGEALIRIRQSASDTLAGMSFHRDLEDPGFYWEYVSNTDIGFNFFYTNVTTPAGAIGDSIDLLSRVPSDLTGGSAFGYPQINFTYYYFNTSNITSPYLFNYTLNRTIFSCVNWINGTCNLANRTWIQANASYIANNTNSSKNITYTLSENDLFSFTANYDFYGSTGTTNVTLGANDWHKETYLNFSNSGNYTLVFESPTNTTGLIRIYLANDSYTEGLNPQSDTNVAEICSILSTDAYNHTHGSDLGHRLCFIQVIDGKYNNMQITNNMSVLTALISGSATIPTINTTTRTGSARYTANNGATWSESYNQRGHVHVFHASDTLFFQAFGNVSTGGRLNSTMTSDNLALTEIPPNNPTITNPTNNANTNASINITWTNAGSGVLYNVTLLNSDLTTNKTLNTSTSLTYYNWNIYSETQAYLGQYYVSVLAYNANGTHIDIEGMNITRNAVLNLSVKRAISNATVTTFNVSYTVGETTDTTTSTIGWVFLHSIRNNNVTFTVQGTNLTSQTNETNTSSGLTNFTTYMYAFNTLIANVYDELTQALIQPRAVYLELISDLFSDNYTTTNGTFILELLDPESYTIRYESSGYPERFYYFTLDNDSFEILDLYLVNETVYSNITVIIYDQTTLPLEEATVKAFKFDITSNSYLLVEICVTNVEGECRMSLTKFDEFYYFIIEYEGETVKITNPAYITKDTISIQVVSGGEILDNFLDYESIDYAMNWNDETNTTTLFFNDVDGLTSQICLRVTEKYAQTETLLAENCSTAVSDTLTLTIDREYGKSYKGISYYTQDGVEHKLAEVSIPSVRLQISSNTSRNMLGIQIFATLLVAIIGTGMGLALFLPVLLPLTVLVGGLIGLNELNSAVVFGFTALGLMISLWLNGKRGRGL